MIKNILQRQNFSMILKLPKVTYASLYFLVISVCIDQLKDEILKTSETESFNTA